jgi:CheY-like chemotaxis protein
VLLDLTLPTLDGMTVLERIRDTSPEVSVVLSSGWAAEEVAERLIAYPEVQFLQKPYTAEALGCSSDQSVRGVPRRPA